MIVNYRENGWEVITQRAHGALAAQLALQWRKADRPKRWAEFLIAVADHDDAQIEIQSGDILTAQDMGLALINQYAEPLDLSKYKDEYHTELLRLIEAKAKGKRSTIKKLKPKAAKADDLYDQLMSSLNVKKGA